MKKIQPPIITNSRKNLGTAFYLKVSQDLSYNIYHILLDRGLLDAYGIWSHINLYIDNILLTDMSPK